MTTKLILTHDVSHLGSAGEVVEVKDGYARNYLIPQRKAKRATPAALAEFEVKRAELEKAQADKLAAAEAQAGQLNGLMVQISRKAGMDGRLFGSVSNFDIAEALEAQGQKVEKAAIRMPNGHLKAIGDYPIDIALHTDVIAQITVSVLGEH